MSDTHGATHLDTTSFQSTLDEAGSKPVFVDFFATWCGPCKMAAPVVDELSSEYHDTAVIAKVDVDENQPLAQQYGVMSIPTVVMFKDGKEVDRVVGFPGKDGYKKLIDAHLG
ncbi:MAG: thioredoxin [Pseudomonadales bacterium]|nr:thioredoxin [Candidatus Woesebacteria bacterium]MCB9801618.1 thioredoxin [Pseudomonadales bacterium]